MTRHLEQTINEIHRKTGDPICAYIYDLTGMQNHVKNMVRTMPKQTNLFYAIKANPDKRLLEALLPFVKGFEVASAGELEKVRKVSKTVPVLFGGPGKKDYELDMALKENVTYIHVESLLELEKLSMLAKERNIHTNVLLRINLRTNTLPKTKISMGGRPSQFGIDEWLIAEAQAILKRESNTHVHFKGFHFHSLSNNLDAGLHVELINHYLQKVNEWKQLYELDVQIINAGGGFGVSYDGTAGFDWDLFASMLAENNEIDRLNNTELFFEPGRFIVADYGFYIAEIIDIKLSVDNYFAILRGGTHHNRLPASWGHNHPFSVVKLARWPYPFKRPEITDSKVTIVGELCTPKDQFYKDAQVENIRVGDAFLFEKSGAYCWTISHHDFLGHPHPDFYYLTGGEKYE